MSSLSNGSKESLPLADYLFARLKQLGVLSVHGLPGDYNLTLLDHVEPSGLLWVGSVNELNAGYAADGYARIKGIGALITTYGVGELSAINAIAGAFTERAAVVHIVGTPPRDSASQRKNIHHTMGDGEYRHFAQMAKHVTVAQAELVDPRTAVEQIDCVLRQCLVHSRPVYLEVPVDMVGVKVDAAALNRELSIPDFIPESRHDTLLRQVLGRIRAADRPMILVDNGTRPLRIAGDVEGIVKTTKWPTFSTASGKALIDNTSPNFHGIYQGAYADVNTKAYVDESDLILCFGPHYSTTNSYALTAIPDSKKTVAFSHDGIFIGSDLHRDIDIKWAVSQLRTQLDASPLSEKQPSVDLPHDAAIEFSEADATQPLKQEKLWKRLANFLNPGDIIFGETGTAGYGVREMPLPQHTTLFTPTTWLSIGYMLPAAQGAALAQRELIKAGQYHGLQQARTVLFIGDGSLQLTVQELATIIRHQLNVVIFVINNDGYTIERCIHGRDQEYNDISQWRYLHAPGLFGAPEDTYTKLVKTYGELQETLGDGRLREGRELRMVEIILERNDAPVGPLLDMLKKQDKDVPHEVANQK